MEHSIETRAVHGGRSDLRKLGVHAPPLDLSTTHPINGLHEAGERLEALANGDASNGNPLYARLGNQTVSRFEHALASLEQSEAAVAFGSGMAAVTACLLAVRERGRHVVAVRPLYGGTDHLLSSDLLGISVSWADASDVSKHVGADTALVVVETPANPTLDLVDIRNVVEQAGSVPVLVDNTFATPVLQSPLCHGAAFSLHSATKYLGGHGDVIGGVVACSEDHARALRRVRVVTGGLLHPLGAYLLHRGLQTLPVRMAAAQANARSIAERLEGHPAISRILYPGFDECDPGGLVGRQMSGPGAMIAFEMAQGIEAAAAVLAHVRLVTPAVSLGSADTLIQHPAGLTHRVVDREALCRSGVTDGLLRLSIGLEHPDDIWQDLAAALAAASMRRSVRVRKAV